MVDLHQSPGALHRERNDASAPQHRNQNGSAQPVSVVDTVSAMDSSAVLVDQAVLLEPWLLTENDLPWLISLGKKRYGLNRGESQFDYLTVEGWFRNIVLKSPLMFYPARLSNSFLIAMISCVPWLPSDFEAHIVFVCAE